MRQYFKPQKRTGKYAFYCFLLLALATGAAILGFELKKSVFYALALSFIFFSVQIFTVYILSTYEYGLDGGILSIYRTVGKYRKCIYDLDLHYAKALLRYKKAKEYVKENGKPKRRFYCLSGSPKRRSAVLFYETDTSFALYFAPDDVFFASVKSYIL